MEWRYADPSHPYISQPVEAAILAEGGRTILQGSAGLVREHDPAGARGTFTGQILSADLDRWRAYLRHAPMASQAKRIPKFDAHLMETQRTEAFILEWAQRAKKEEKRSQKTPADSKKKRIKK